MTGRTHLAVGVGTSLLLTMSNNIEDIAVCTVAAAIGSTISDIDVNTSNSHKKLTIIIAAVYIFTMALIFLEYQWNIGLLNMIEKESSVTRVIVGFVLMICICAFGLTTTHRTFMHSILGLLILSADVFYILPNAMPYFSVSMGTHILLDLLNKKRVRLFYPSKKMVGVALCKNDGLVNNIFFCIGIVAIFNTLIFKFVR